MGFGGLIAKKRWSAAAVAFAALSFSRGVLAPSAAQERWSTWADSHPEVVEIFGLPFAPEGTELRRRFPSWPAEEFPSTLAASQPTLAITNDQVLIAHSWSGIARSTDGGRTWTNVDISRSAEIPPRFKLLQNSLDGCGVTENGTILAHFAVQYNDGRKYEGLSDPTYHVDLYVVRSTDGGQTWEEPLRLNAAPLENAGGHRTRFARLADGVVALSMGVWYQMESGKPIPPSERYERTFIWRSRDDGRTWQRDPKPMCLYGAEPDLLQLPTGRILAAVRYQRHKLPSDPPDLALPHHMRNDVPPYANSKDVGHGFAIRATAILHSDDNGQTWSEPRLVTGFDEQSGCLVRLADGGVALVFGHKTDGTGQRFMLSYDEGETWSRTVYQLGWNGLYASSVVLDDETIVSVFHRTVDGVGKFFTLRWRPPSRETVSQGGFWRPRALEPLGQPSERGGEQPGNAAQGKASAGWQDGQETTIEGLRVHLSRPVRVARSRGYLWFPTLARLSDGTLLATMNNYPDEHVEKATAFFAWSEDGGLTWSKPVEGLYGDVSLTTPNGDELLLPYYQRPISEGIMGATYQICPKGGFRIVAVDDGVRVSGWPRPDRSLAPEFGLSGFVFNGQSVPLKEGGYLAMLYGFFDQAAKRSLVAAESSDGIEWKIQATIADHDCALPGANGPCESAICRLKDGRLMCVFRMETNFPYGQTFSGDEGVTWTEPIAMKGVRSVQPSLAVMPDGTVALSGGRPGLFLWVDSDGDGEDWREVDLLANHNEYCPDESILDPKKTTSYTEVVALDENHLLYIYDRIPHGWARIPDDSRESNSVWVVRVTLEEIP